MHLQSHYTYPTDSVGLFLSTPSSFYMSEEVNYSDWTFEQEPENVYGVDLPEFPSLYSSKEPSLFPLEEDWLFCGGPLAGQHLESHWGTFQDRWMEVPKAITEGESRSTSSQEMEGEGMRKEISRGESPSAMETEVSKTWKANDSLEEEMIATSASGEETKIEDKDALPTLSGEERVTEKEKASETLFPLFTFPPVVFVTEPRVFPRQNSEKRSTRCRQRSEKLVCSHCNKSFDIMTNFKAHLLTHQEVRPHSCKICSKTFKHPTNLRHHMVTHSPTKPWPCSLCEGAFTTKGNLVRHMNTVHKVKELP